MGAPPQIPLQDLGQAPVANQGGTVRPVYGIRHPVMYHLFETELQSVSAFNGEALRWFAIGTFLVNIVIAITCNWISAVSPLPDYLKPILSKVEVFLVLMALVSYGFAIWALLQRKRLIDQVKKRNKSRKSSCRLTATTGTETTAPT